LLYEKADGEVIRKELSGGFPDTTNNRMELFGAIAALEALSEPCAVTLTSDSKYLTDAINKGWLANWKKRNWVRGKNDPVLNIDLWERLDIQLRRHNVLFVWVKGHNSNVENERCDELARNAIDR
jgi:ribonuclease HI